MSLGNLALGGVLVLGTLYLLAILAGLLAAWPWGLIGLVVLGFAGLLLGGVLRQRMRDAEDAHYTRNVKD